MKATVFIQHKFTKKGCFLIAAMAVVFLFCLVLFFTKPARFRLFIFESLDYPGLFAEKRFLAKSPVSDQVQFFAEDLLLGPLTPRLKPIFPVGTSILSCFIRDKTLYVDLSAQALVYPDGSAVTPYSVEIFKKNIFKNFNFINNIHIYIMGREVEPVM